MSDELFAIADGLIARARPGEQIEVVVGRSRSTEVRAYEGDVESLSSATSAGVGVRVVADARQGFAYAGSLDPDVLADVLAEARDNATFGTPDEHLGLAEPDGVPFPTLDLHRPSLASVPTQDKVALAIELERAVRAADARISGVEASEYGDHLSEGVVVTTTGIRVADRDSGCYVGVYPLATERDETKTGFGFSVGRELAELDVAAAAADAARRATRLLGATKPAGRRCTVVLDPYVTAQLIGIIAGTLNGESVLKGRSLFGERLGETIAAPSVTLVDDPTDPRAYGATASDGEGLATRRNQMIDGGVLRQFAHNTYTARRAGTRSTGSAVRGFKSTPGVGCRAVSLRPGSQTQEELLAQVGDGVLIASVAGLHSGVNAVSGDFSTGAEGLRIVDGSLAEPLREFTIASTLQRLLLDVIAVGSDVEWLPMSATGVSLVVGDVTVSGT